MMECQSFSAYWSTLLGNIIKMTITNATLMSLVVNMINDDTFSADIKKLQSIILFRVP